MSDNNGTVFKPECPKPFLDMSQFPVTGGHIPGRVCSEVQPGLSCCLPCPATDWIYPPSFETWYRVSQAISVVGMVICVFLLVSWTILPPERTKRHYLSIGLVIGIFLEGLAFVVPLMSHPKECYNAITPNDMSSNLSCAFSGSFIVLGGLIVTAWITMRALSMHLQVCWDVVPGTKFLYFSNILGWGLSGLFFTLTMALVGVSYRFSDTCHVNPHGAMAVFWAPLLAMAGLAALLQVATFLYCFKVYLSNLWHDEPARSNTSAGIPSFTSSHRRAQATRAVYKRVKEVLWLQWRSVTIIIFLLVDIVFFSIVWIHLDSAINSAATYKKPQMLEFLGCILINSTVEARSKCFKLGQSVLVSEQICVAVLLLISLSGIQTGLLLIRSSLIREWRDLLREKFGRKQEFVSLDAKRFSVDPRGVNHPGYPNITYPLNRMGTPTHRVASANTADTYSTKEPGGSPYLAQHSISNAERNYRQPRMSFSTPRPAPTPVPSTPPPGHRPAWDASETYASPGTPGSSHLHNTPSSRPFRDNYDGRV